MKRARIIYNPTSGRELMMKQLPYVLERLEKAGYETSAHKTTGEGCATNAAKLAVKHRFDLVVIAGGDGTIFEVVNGLAEQEYRPLIGLLPTGTTNDFARALGIPRNVKKACDIICDGNVKPIDVGKAGQRYFVNIAAGGSLTELTYEVPSKLKTVLGRLAYFFKGFIKLPFITPKRVRIEYDGNFYEGDIMLFLICNTNSVGGFERLAIRSKVDDGKFDLVIAEKMPIPKFVHLGMQTFSGRHLKNAKIKYIQASKINIESEMPLNLDGEYGGVLPTEFINLHHHFELLVPKKDK